MPILRHSSPLAFHSPQRSIIKTEEKKRASCSSKRKMRLSYVCEGQEKELGRQQAPGTCPHCGGKVEVMDVEVQSKLCFLPMCFQIKRKYFCTLCSRRLETLYD
ncbi:unnamed protein product [Trifolium pratense]|uniref:Uncharacterized protein n=1 Tax=Trifolium pratense TaxID=57577 RepID=A0ACB0JYD0_TRIPR|nr:unnamed protein product [Trifolium pratense]